MERIEVKFTKLVEWAKVPEYETKKSSGCDIALSIREEFVLYPREIHSLPTGIAIQVPLGFEGQIRSRSGMARKGIIVANTPGTIDAEHTEEIKILLVNITDKPIKVFPDQKVAQIVFAPIVKADFVD